MRGYLQYTSTATGQTTAKPLLQLTNETHHVTLVARSRDDHTQLAAQTSTSENTAHTTIKVVIPITTKVLYPAAQLTTP